MGSDLREAVKPFERWARWALEKHLSPGSDRQLHEVEGMLHDMPDDRALTRYLSPDEPQLLVGHFRALLVALDEEQGRG